jgi:hypothetical protein
LHYAAACGDVGAATWLMSYQSSPFAADFDGFTPDHYATEAGLNECADVIREKAAELTSAAAEAEAQHILIGAHDDVQRLIDPDSGHAYYLNMRTGESRWETDKEAEEYEVARKFKVLEERRKIRAEREAAAQAKVQAAKEKQQKLARDKADALNYFTDLVKQKIKPLEDVEFAEDRLRVKAVKAQALVKRRAEEAPVDVPAVQAANMSVEAMRERERAQRLEAERKINGQDDETWWREEKKRLQADRKAARLEAEKLALVAQQKRDEFSAQSGIPTCVARYWFPARNYCNLRANGWRGCRHCRRDVPATRARTTARKRRRFPGTHNHGCSSSKQCSRWGRHAAAGNDIRAHAGQGGAAVAGVQGGGGAANAGKDCCSAGAVEIAHGKRRFFTGAEAAIGTSRQQWVDGESAPQTVPQWCWYTATYFTPAPAAVVCHACHRRERDSR